MIFMYKGKASHAFTMVGMNFNIDMIFLSRPESFSRGSYYQIIHIEENAEAGKYGYRSPIDYHAVLEVPAKDSITKRIRTGDVMILSKEPLMNAPFLDGSQNTSYTLKTINFKFLAANDDQKKNISSSFSRVTEIMSTEEFKKRFY